MQVLGYEKALCFSTFDDTFPLLFEQGALLVHFARAPRTAQLALLCCRRRTGLPGKVESLACFPPPWLL